MFAFLDTPFDPDFPVYTRANAGQILPDPLPPLAWTVVGPALEEGFRVAFCDDFGLHARPGPDRPFQTVGRMAARLHLNLSIIQTSGAEPEEGVPGAPSHAAAGGRLLLRLRKTPAVGKTLAGLGRRVNRDRAAVDELAAQVAARLESDDTTVAELIPLLRSAAALYGRTLGTHVTAQGLIVPMAEQARGALRRAEIATTDAERLLAEVPDLESERPLAALAEIARSIPSGSPLTDLVAKGSFTDIEASDESGAADLCSAITGVLAEFGHWGPAGFDPTSTAWAQDPDTVVRQIAAMVADPPHLPDPLDLDPGRLARPLVAAARSAVARAERTRETMMRSTDVVRRLLFAVRDRAPGALEPDLYWFCTLAELETVAYGGGAPATEELRRRAADFAAATAFTPAERSEGRLLAAGDVETAID